MLLLLLDAAVYGGIALKPPNTPLPELDCKVRYRGPVLIWPWDATDGEKSRSQLYQLLHEQPAAHTGIASWALVKDQRVEMQLRSSGFRRPNTAIDVRRLQQTGYRWVIAEKAADAEALKTFLGAPVEDCGAHFVYQLPGYD